MRRLAAALALGLVLAAPARAGGDFVDLAVSGGTAWFVGSFGIRAIGGQAGRETALPSPGAYPLSVTTAGGAVWVASVANGFVDGKLIRIDRATGRTRVVLREPTGSVQAVAAGGGSVYALVGRPVGNAVVRLTPGGSISARWPIVDAGRIAADASGCWVSAGQRLLHVRPDGRIVTVLTGSLGDVATGAGAAWLPQPGAIVRIDERTGVGRSLRAPGLRLGGFQHDLAVGAGALWTLDATTSSLQKRDLGTGRVEAAVRLPGLADAVVATPEAVWVGVAVTHEVLRFDPGTLRRTLDVTVS